MYVASYVRANSKHEVRLIDLRVNKTPIGEFLGSIWDWAPDVVGVTGMSIEWSGIKSVIEAVRGSLGEKAKIIVGGPHASCFPEMILERTDADFVAVGEGERTMLSLLEVLDKYGDPGVVKGIMYRGPGGIVNTGPCERVDNLDDLPFPAFDLLTIEDYFVNPHFHTNLNKYNRIAPIFTSRGCPFKCGFCFHPMGFKFRPRSPKNVLAEIEQLVTKYGIQELHIEDDTFNFQPARAKAIMRGIIDRGLKLTIAFPSGVRGDLLDDELISLFIRAGVYRVHFGIESAADRIQGIIGKKLDFAKLEKSLDAFSKTKVSTHGFFMMGFPTETEEEIMQTIDFAAKSKLVTANFSLLQLFPGTPFSNTYLKDTPAVRGDDFSFSYDCVATNCSAVSSECLKKLQQTAMIRFYAKPGRVWRIFITSPNKKNLFFRNFGSVWGLIFKGKTKY